MPTVVKLREHRADGEGMLATRLCSDDRGFTLVEVLVAVHILLVGVLGVTRPAAAAFDECRAGSRSRNGAWTRYRNPRVRG